MKDTRSWIIVTRGKKKPRHIHACFGPFETRDDARAYLKKCKKKSPEGWKPVKAIICWLAGPVDDP